MRKRILTGTGDRAALADYLKQTPLIEYSDCDYHYEPYPKMLLDETVTESATLLSFALLGSASNPYLHIGIWDASRPAFALTVLLTEQGEALTVTALAAAAYGVTFSPEQEEGEVLTMLERVLFDYGFPMAHPERFAPPPKDPVGKFERSFQNYTEKQLQKVVDGKDYVPDAKKAAKNLLYRMKYGE